jgi:iron complex transport system permease protein
LANGGIVSWRKKSAMKRFTRWKFFLLITILSVMLIAGIISALLLGSINIDFTKIVSILFHPSEEFQTQHLILFEIRLPRIILAIIIGTSLALSGAAFQGFFRNSLADPFVIGASSGAALGAALAIVFGFSFISAAVSPSIASFVGALLAVFLAFIISRAGGNPPPAAALLLAGTALSSFFSSLLSLILVLHDQDLHRVYYWLLGSLSGTTWQIIFTILPVSIISWCIIFLCIRPLDLFLQGEDVAESLGLDIKKTRIIIAAGATLAAASSVAAVGIIGFIGLLAPHSVRMMTGPKHSKLLPASALMGANLVLWADIIARTIIPPMEIPIGIITSLAGVPFFLYLMIRRGKNLGSFS